MYNDRDYTITKAREIMQQDFVVFDTETTGLDPKNGDEAVSIGLVSKSGKILMDTLLRHKKRSDPRALEIHGHTWEETREAPTFLQVVPQLITAIGDKQILCYCVGNFDANILLSSGYAAGLEERNGMGRFPVIPQLDFDYRHRTIQVLPLFADFYGEWNDSRESYKWQSLTTAARFFDIDTAGAHGAAADCRMTLRVVEAMAAWKLESE